jgi:hypothetical protein
MYFGFYPIDETLFIGSCTASVRLMHGVVSKPVCRRKMIFSAGLKWGGHRFP